MASIWRREPSGRIDQYALIKHRSDKQAHLLVADFWEAPAGSGVSGNLTATEVGNDGLTSVGKVLVRGNLTATEVGNDGFAGTGGGAFSAIVGNLSGIESGGDTLAGVGEIIVSGVLAATELPDTFNGLGRVKIRGALSVTENGSDVFAGAGGTSPPPTLGVLVASFAATSFAVGVTPRAALSSTIKKKTTLHAEVKAYD